MCILLPAGVKIGLKVTFDHHGDPQAVGIPEQGVC
jgi:hypothetical protein